MTGEALREALGVPQIVDPLPKLAGGFRQSFGFRLSIPTLEEGKFVVFSNSFFFLSQSLSPPPPRRKTRKSSQIQKEEEKNEKKKGWICEKCTFKNNLKTDKCFLCDEQRTKEPIETMGYKIYFFSTRSMKGKYRVLVDRIIRSLHGHLNFQKFHKFL